MLSKKVRSKIVHSKVYAMRTITYLQILNFLMLIWVSLANLDRYKDINIGFWLIPIMAISGFILILIGYLEDRAGYFQQEQNVIGKRNPYLVETLERVKKIEMRLKK